MKLYHNTTDNAVDAILTTGFRDTTGKYLTEIEWSGVWFSNYPLGPGEGCKGNKLLVVELPISDSELSKYEWVDDASPYREFLIPAGIINYHGKVWRATEADEAEGDEVRDAVFQRILDTL